MSAIGDYAALVGRRFGRMIVIAVAPRVWSTIADKSRPGGTRRRSYASVYVDCDCGTRRHRVLVFNLTRKDARRSLSCGCIRGEVNRSLKRRCEQAAAMRALHKRGYVGRNHGNALDARV